MHAEGYHFTHTLRVRYSEIDGQKIVYNAHYLTYLDIAFSEYFRAIRIDVFDGSDFDSSLVKATLEYKRPARLDDLLDIHFAITRLGNTSFTGRFRISPHDKPAADEAIMEAEIIYVAVSPEGRPVSIPPAVRAKIAAIEGIPG